MNNQISFKSRIQFVSPQIFFKKIKHAEKLKYGCGGSGGLTFADKFYTLQVRTCTAGGLIEPNKNVLGFHIYDNAENYNNIFEKFERYVSFPMFNPKSALILGSKDLPEEKHGYSIKIFQKMKEYFASLFTDMSIFEKHKIDYSQSNLLYSLKQDKWFISTEFLENGKRKYVQSPEDLMKTFEHISISPKDKLFIGKHEIYPPKYPQFFQKKPPNHIISFIKVLFSQWRSRN